MANILILTVRVKTRITAVGGYQLLGVTYGLNRQGQAGGKVYKDDTKSIHSMNQKTSCANDCFSLRENILRLLWNLKFRCCIRKSKLLLSALKIYSIPSNQSLYNPF